MKILFTFLCCIISSLAYSQVSVTTVLDSEELWTDYHTWSVVSVERKSDCTVVKKYVAPLDYGETWIASSRDEFIEDALSGERYYIQSSEIGFEQNKVVLGEFKDRMFEEVYPKLPDGVSHINISSGSKYFIKSLDLSLTVSPLRPPVSQISQLGINLGVEYGTAVRELMNRGYKAFYKEQTESFFGGEDLCTYFYGKTSDYNVTVKLTSSVQHGVVTDLEILYQNHIDTYEAEEHLQELVDEVSAAYPYIYYQDTTPDYTNAATLLDMKSGEDRIFKNLTQKIFRGECYIGNSPEDKKDDALEFIVFEVHSDRMHSDYIIRVDYSDRKVTRYIKRCNGKGW